MRPLLLLLLATAHGLDVLSYKPTLVGDNVKGNVTGSTFVLEQPRCIFDKYNTANIWLVVATRAAREPQSIPMRGGVRSGAMITITAILSVLLAVLLAALLATLCSSEACGVGSFRPDTASIRRYNTHHVYDQPAARL
ncbi:hypothetical protein CIB84_016801 [Bambusicola thoracicus]|uniref:Uncharacterized protein n=1 Tax=Bambusicola thoracicus TaxID=9083 RepID=A0A2P4S5T6_BAMTH|nr:hypothetical protein CIB84_016801 [Bambusicola thoracicus]